MNQATRALAVALRPTKPQRTERDAEVVSVSGSLATIRLDGSLVDVPGVPVVPGLALTAGQGVVVERSPHSPRIIRRIS